jgi:hypothetical protein
MEFLEKTCLQKLIIFLCDLLQVKILDDEGRAQAYILRICHIVYITWVLLYADLRLLFAI